MPPRVNQAQTSDIYFYNSHIFIACRVDFKSGKVVASKSGMAVIVFCGLWRVPFSLRHLRNGPPPSDYLRGRCLREGPRANRLRRPPLGPLRGQKSLRDLRCDGWRLPISGCALSDCSRIRSADRALSPVCSLRQTRCCFIGYKYTQIPVLLSTPKDVDLR